MPKIYEFNGRASDSDLEEKEVRRQWRFQTELNEFLLRTLTADGCASAEVHVTPIRTEIVIRATRDARYKVGRYRRIREDTSVVQKRFGLPENRVKHFTVTEPQRCR